MDSTVRQCTYKNVASCTAGGDVDRCFGLIYLDFMLIIPSARVNLDPTFMRYHRGDGVTPTVIGCYSAGVF